MKVTCQNCQSNYNVSDEKARAGSVKLKCRQCGTMIAVGAPSSAGLPEPTPSAAAAAVVYTVAFSDADQRSMTIEEIVAAYGQGIVGGDTFLWGDGMTDWTPLANVEPVVLALHEAAAAAAPEVPDSVPALGDLAAAPMAEPMFGARAAQEPRPLGRIPQPPPSAPKAGDEASMMFSLRALTAKSTAQAPAGLNKPAKDEDSGIIDFAALAAQRAAREAANKAAQTPAPPSVDAGLFPLGAAPLVASPLHSVPPPVKSKAPLPVGTLVNLRFTVIMDDIETIEGTGEVVRTEEGGMGIVFREISAYSKAIIDRLLLGRALWRAGPPRC